MFPQPTLPKRLYLYAGLSLLALGYCAGRSCSNEPATQAPSTLEQTITKTIQEQQSVPTSQPAPEPQQPVKQPKPLTIEQRLLRYLKHPVHNPGDPLPSDVPFKQPRITVDSSDNPLERMIVYAHQTLTRIRNETYYTYAETKDYLKEKCREAGK